MRPEQVGDVGSDTSFAVWDMRGGRRDLRQRNLPLDDVPVVMGSLAVIWPASEGPGGMPKHACV